MSTRLFWLLLLVLAVVVGFFGYQVLREHQRLAENSPQGKRPAILSTDPVRGEEKASVTVIEYGDFQCPFCRSEQADLKTFLAKYRKRVRLVWKDYPLEELHPEAVNAAEAARCAQEQNAFWQMHDALFANQERLGPTTYIELAQSLQLNIERFQDCLSSDRTIPLITAATTDARQLGIDGTPYYFFGETAVTSLPSAEELDRFLDQS